MGPVAMLRYAAIALRQDASLLRAIDGAFVAVAAVATVLALVTGVPALTGGPLPLPLLAGGP